VLRPDKPEEHVRQRWARSLIDEYGYKASDIAVEFRIKMGSTSKRVDLAIFKPGAPKKQENIFIVIEVSPQSVRAGRV